MTDSTPIDAQAVFVKTPQGAEEIQRRTLGLGLLQRRVLLLVDGRRTGADVAKLAGNADVGQLMSELLALGCIEQLATQAVTPVQLAAAPESSALAGLPPPESRTAAQSEMARHFMINTINRMLEQNSRLSLVGKIFGSVDAAELRLHFPAWEEAIGSSWMGRKRLDELRAKLFEVL